MKNRLYTISTREIKKSFKRFLSLLIMSFLGVTVFVGLKNTPGTMLSSLDKYYDETNHYDIKIISTLGLTDDDVNALNNTGIKSYGTHSKDVITKFQKETQVVKLIGINNNINKILLTEGTLPLKENEIAVESNILKIENLKIGDYIEIESDDTLKTNKFKIVGTVRSPLYLFVGGNSMIRGNTNIGNGRIEYYSYVNDNAFNMDYYTEIYVSIPNDYITSTEKYIDLVNKKIDIIESIKSQREQARYDSIINESNKEIDKKEEEALTELNKASNELKINKRKLDNGYSQLVSSKKELDNSKQQLDQTLITLNTSKELLESNEILLNNTKQELFNAEKELTALLKEYGLTIDDIITIKEILNDQVVSKERLKHIFTNSEYKEQIEELIDKLYETNFLVNLKDYIETSTEEAKTKLIESLPKDIENYDEIVSEIESFNKDTIREKIYTTILDSAYNIDDLKTKIPESLPCYDKIIDLLDNYANTIIKIKDLFDAVDKLVNGKEEIKKNEQLLIEKKEQLETGYQTYNTYLNLYNEGLSKYRVGYNDYKKGLNLYNVGLEEYLNSKAIFEREIANARSELSKIEKPEWFIYDRSDDSEYSGYLNNTESITKLAGVFPTVFFLVAIFMCIMCMSRMALEDCQEIGTLKSLGFSNKHIYLKYILYSSIATILGSILGGIIGFYFLTLLIFKMYGMLYVIPFFAYQFDILPFILGTIIALICISGTSILTVKSIVKEKPSNLLRPITPNKGKKLLIEHIPLWNKINFSNKITIRNIVRYKKRVIMTILGITGCTVLLLTGYGIKDSITSITDKHFEEIFLFDHFVYLDHKVKDITPIINSDYLKSYQEANVQTVKVNNLSADLYALNDNHDYNVINITDYKTHEKLTIEPNKVIITEKLASINNYKVGDKVKIIDSNNKSYEFEISGIATNYIGSVIYMNINLYEQNYGEYIPNIVYLSMKDNIDEDKYIKELIENEHILSVISKNTLSQNVTVMLQSLDQVVLILLVLSGMLSFVVLYNISYINISERKREIATLKVLGFTHGEVDNYIIKENFIITIIGIILGLILAKPFVDYIVNTIELELVRFVHIINYSSYLYTFLFMMLFTGIVTVIIHFALKKINMIESLKTVE